MDYNQDLQGYIYLLLELEFWIDISLLSSGSRFVKLYLRGENVIS